MNEDKQSPDKTMKYNVPIEENQEVRDIFDQVYEALKEKGYNPINQLVGYFMSGDPTYITNHKNARSLIRRIERDELLEEVLKTYLKE